jgi:hypothetical protein
MDRTMELSAIDSLITEQHVGIHRKLNHFLSTGKIPNIIFHGLAGTGKKTIIFNFLHRIYGNTESSKNSHKELIGILKNNVMSVNCCHGKGIKFIREELKFFSKINIQHTTGVHFKSIVLFNADCLTIDAQSALRRCIELFSHNTRFFIVVENIHKLLKPIVSRFCEIYVPQIMVFNKDDEKSTFINLHQYQIECPSNNITGTDSQRNDKKMEEIHNKITSGGIHNKITSGGIHNNITSGGIHNNITSGGIHNNITSGGIQGENKTPADWTNMVDYFYENGISAIDILTYLKNREDKYPRESIHSIELEFHKIKGNYKNEKLLMFRILWFIHKHTYIHTSTYL